MKFINYLGDQRNIRTLKRAFYVILAVVVAVDFLVPHEHVEFPWDAIPGFSAFYGFLSCVIIVIVSKWVGHLLLMKKEDYYD